jgi:DNA replication and repair protein RecF
VPIKSVHLKHFRCFTTLTLDLDNPIVFIRGDNGIGKTSILEALHYACYLKSFKTHIPKDLIQMERDGFSIQVTLGTTTPMQDDIAIGFTGTKRSVKINQKAANSYKELLSIYKVITLTEDDLQLIKGAPSIRRTFIDQLLVLLDFSFSESLRTYKTVLDNRNALLASGIKDTEQYLLWTDQLLSISRVIQLKRITLLRELEKHIQELSSSLFPNSAQFNLTYKYAQPYTITPDITDATSLLGHYARIYNHEYGFKRTLIGAHLDDIHIIFQNKMARLFASRGQQKCLVFLLKLAQLKSINMHTSADSAIFLIDDFMVDLDTEKMTALIPLITQLAQQVIITSPTEQTILKDILYSHQPDAKMITL